MKNKLKKCVICLLLIGFGVLIGSLSSKEETILEEKTFVKKDVNTLSMMLETEAGSGNYELTTRSEWPTDGYVFNPELSVCEHGGELSWDDENKRILMSGNMSDKCYVYFDVYILPAISDFCNSGDTLVACIKNFGDQGPEISNIYIHNSNLVNGAGDNSYRYAGASDKTNNYLCFGSDEIPCPKDNLYQIIGGFSELSSSQFLIKIIKNLHVVLPDDYYNIENLIEQKSDALAYFNDEWINKFADKWANKIQLSYWPVSKFSSLDLIGKDAYLKETSDLNNLGCDEYSIGLLYPSDYAFSATSYYWNLKLRDTNGYYDGNKGYVGDDYSKAIGNNWLFDYQEAVLMSTDNESQNGVVVHYYGFLYLEANNNALYYPVFYLNSNITYISGDGTNQNPIRIN